MNIGRSTMLPSAPSDHIDLDQFRLKVRAAKLAVQKPETTVLRGSPSWTQLVRAPAIARDAHVDPISAAPQRVIPNCNACPVERCPARSESAAESWREMMDLMGPQLPGAAMLMRIGQPLTSLFSVRAGCIKSYTIDAQGNEHVRAFHFPGDLVGLEALGAQRAHASATPVMPSQVCAVPVAELELRMKQDPKIAGELLRKAQYDLRQALALTGEYAADERVAAFLLLVHARTGGGNVLRLPMTRREIGSYLRLATETVCRMLTRFEQKGWLISADKRITLLDKDALRDLSAPMGLF